MIIIIYTTTTNAFRLDNKTASNAEQRDILLILNDQKNNVRLPERFQSYNIKPNPASNPMHILPITPTPSTINQNNYQQIPQQQHLGIILPYISTNRRPLETHQNVIIYSNSADANANANRFIVPNGLLHQHHQIQLYITRPKDEKLLIETKSTNSSSNPAKLMEHKMMMMNNSGVISRYSGGTVYEVPQPIASETYYGYSGNIKRSPFSVDD